MHDAVKIISEWWSDTVCLEVVALGGLDVTPVNGYMIVSVWSHLFMVEANGVHELVMDNIGVTASRSQTQFLNSSSPADHGKTTIFINHIDVSGIAILNRSEFNAVTQP